MKKSIWKICAACLSVLLLHSTFGQPLQAADELTSETTITSTESSANEKISAENSVTSSEQLQESALYQASQPLNHQVFLVRRQ